jgi:chromosome segregation ATPase
LLDTFRSLADCSSLGAEPAWFQAANARSLTAALAPVRADIARLDGRLDNMDGRLLAMDNRLDAMDGRLNTVDGRLNAMDGRLQAIDAGLNTLKEISAQTQRIAAIVESPTVSFHLFSSNH